MYGVLTGDAELAREGIGDVGYYLAERVDGSRRDPIPGTITTVACWGDTEAVRERPDRAAVTTDGRRATPDAEGHHWGTVCPTDPDYRRRLLDRIARYGEAGSVRLTTVGFPGSGFCRCERCERLFAESGAADRDAWRTDVVTEFVAAAAERTDEELIATLYPDPYPGNLRARAGLDPQAMAEHVDGFLVTLCGSYETPYWVESLARGFGAELESVDASLAIQLSADADVDRLVDVTRMVEPHCEAVVYGTTPADAETVRAVIRRRSRAEAGADREPTDRDQSIGAD